MPSFIVHLVPLLFTPAFTCSTLPCFSPSSPICPIPRLSVPSILSLSYLSDPSPICSIQLLSYLSHPSPICPIPLLSVPSLSYPSHPSPICPIQFLSYLPCPIPLLSVPSLSYLSYPIILLSVVSHPSPICPSPLICPIPLLSVPSLSYMSHPSPICPVPLLSVPSLSYLSYPSPICPVPSLSYLSHPPPICPIPLLSVPSLSYLSHPSPICPIPLLYVPSLSYLSHPSPICPIPLLYVPSLSSALFAYTHPTLRLLSVCSLTCLVPPLSVSCSSLSCPLSCLSPYSLLSPVFLSYLSTASMAEWLRRPPRERKTRGSNPACDGIFPGRVILVTSKLALQRLPCQAPGIIGSVLGLAGPVSVYCDWLR